MTDEEFEAEVRRRLDPQNPDGGYSALGLHVAVNDCGYTLEELRPDTPRRVWILTRGSWASPRCEFNPFRFLPAPPVFLGGDEFGNRPLCFRLPGKRLLCLNWRIPLLSTPYDPDGEAA